MDLLADGFGHGHGSVMGSDEEIGAGFRDGSAPVGGGNGEMIEAGFAGVVSVVGFVSGLVAGFFAGSRMTRAFGSGMPFHTGGLPSS